MYLFPLVLYIPLVALARLVWRRRRLDRGEVLFWSWLSIITVWALVLLDAVFSNFTLAWSEFIVGTATLIGGVLGAVVAFGYLYWPSSEATAVVERPSEFDTSKGEAIKRTQKLGFILTSTTDWFEIGIKDGELISVAQPQIRKGSIASLDPQKKHFHVNHAESSELKTTIYATFQLPVGTVYCILRKGDKGRLSVDVMRGNAIGLIGSHDYTVGPSPKNEVMFPIRL